MDNYSRGSHVDATWHSRPCGSTTRAHATTVYIYILFILYSRGIQPFVYRKGIHPLKLAQFIYLLISLTLLRVGLNPLISCKTNRWIEARDASHVDSVDAKTTAASITHVAYRRNYNSQILGDVAASHTLITWMRGPPDRINARVI